MHRWESAIKVTWKSARDFFDGLNFDSVRAEVIANPDMESVCRELSDRWKALSEEEKEPYRVLERNDHRRNLREKGFPHVTDDEEMPEIPCMQPFGSEEDWRAQLRTDSWGLESWWANTAETRKQVCRAQMLRVEMRNPEDRRKRQEEAYYEAVEDVKEHNWQVEDEAQERRYQKQGPNYDSECDTNWHESSDSEDEGSCKSILRRRKPQPTWRNYVDDGPDVSWLPEISLNPVEWQQQLWQEELHRRRRMDIYLRRSPGYGPVAAEVGAKCTQLRWGLVRRHVWRCLILRYWQAAAEAAEERSAMWLHWRREAWKAQTGAAEPSSWC